MTEGAYPTAVPRYLVEMDRPGAGHLQVDHTAPTSGLFVPSVGVWDWVEEGQVLGVVRHPDGRGLAEVKAVRSGRVLFLRTLPRIASGDAVAFVLALPGPDA
jgi:predicted deacylase